MNRNDPVNSNFLEADFAGAILGRWYDKSHFRSFSVFSSAICIVYNSLQESVGVASLIKEVRDMMQYFKLAICLFLLLAFSGNCFSQTQRESTEKTTEFIASLLQSLDISDTNKLVILYEDNEILIETTQAIFIDSLSKWLKTHSISSDQKLLDKIQSDTGKVINAMKIAGENNLGARLKFRTFDLIDNGECRIMEKNTQTYHKEIKVQKYVRSSGPNSVSGKRYFLGTKKILDGVTAHS